MPNVYYVAMNMTQSDAAKQLGITKQHLNGVIRRRLRCSAELAVKIESVLGIPRESLRPDLYRPATAAGEKQPMEAA